MIQHQQLSSGRWFTLTLAEQLGNVGSEFGRAIAAHARKDVERAQAATARFFELIDLTIADPRWRGARRRELSRVREQAVIELSRADASGSSLQKYFDQFALLARAKR